MIKIVDSIMGSGKSTWAINFINEHPNDRYIIICQYLDEAERYRKGCPEARFCAPDDRFSKSADFEKLIMEGRNITTTHALFSIIDISEKLRERIRELGYTLIIDEVIDVIEPLTIGRRDIQAMFDTNLIEVDEGGKVRWIEKSYRDNLFKVVKEKALSNTLTFFENSIFLWLLPKETIEAFEEMIVMTFNFEGSLMKTYLDSYAFPYEIFHIENGRLKYGKQDLTNLKVELSNLIHVYDGKLNNIGRKSTCLSKTWYLSDKSMKDIVSQNARSYFRSSVKTSAQDCLWAGFNDVKVRLDVRGFQSGRSMCNERATNKWSDRHNLAYLTNIYINPYIVKWFKKKGVNISQDDYAFNQMMQWIWRSAIRKGEPINIYIPSSRMRNLLTKFLDS